MLVYQDKAKKKQNRVRAVDLPILAQFLLSGYRNTTATPKTITHYHLNELQIIVDKGKHTHARFRYHTKMRMVHNLFSFWEIKTE